MSMKSPATLPLKDRLSLRMFLLFGAAFALVFLGGLALDVFASLGENILIDSQTPAPQAVSAIDPKLATELAKVLATDDAPASADIRDPFNDQAGISNLSKTTVGAVTPGATSGTATVGP